MSTIIKPHPLINEPTPKFCIPDANGRIFKFPPEEQGQRVCKPIAVFFYRESGTQPSVHMRRSGDYIHTFAPQGRPFAPARLANFAMR